MSLVPHSKETDNPSSPVSQCLFLVFSLFFLCSPISASEEKYDKKNEFSKHETLVTLKQFTHRPHPMGTPAQQKFSTLLVQKLQGYGLSVEQQTFNAIVPNTKALVFGGQEKSSTVHLTGKNIIATREGLEECLVLLAGHYDTKLMKEVNFVGANDGGSSTALLVELGRLLGKKQQYSPKTFGACTVSFVFFDGEESVLLNWNLGEQVLGIQDNLYGSREFITKYHRAKNGKHCIKNKPLEIAFILDMIGHKNQKLLISKNSSPRHSKLLLKSAHKLTLKESALEISDDHEVFMQRGLPFLHIIDWVNLKEWHTDKDTLDIISLDAIANLGKTLLNFLKEKRI
ncbi:MAG: M28 family peptidase [Silvanigrellaceae bacterium]|nr:M28 family peptidase [Silvanigrellaceae bacterium]